MHVRVVRFTDVDPGQIERLLARVNESGGPPPGITIHGLQILFDEQQRTAVVLQLFDSAADMAAAEEAFSSMDPGETPGTRASVDRCEMKADLRS